MNNMQVNDSKKYLNSITYLRGVMILIVVLGHSLSIFKGDYAGHVMIESEFWLYIRTFIYSFHMPVFMAISGYLFWLEVKKSYDKKTFDGFGRFVVKKFKRLMIPFFIVLYLFRKPLYILADLPAYNDMTWQEKIKSYLSVSTTGALWFLYVLFGIFLVQRVLVTVIWKNNKTVVFFGTMFFIMSVEAYRLSGPLHHVLLYNYYFFMGIIIHKYIKGCPKLLLSISLLSAFLGTAVVVWIQPKGALGALIGTVTATADIFLAFELSGRCKQHIAKPIEYISDRSMGIYLFHEPSIIIVGGMLPESMGGEIAACFFLIGLSSSILITELLRKIRMGFIMGEWK